MSYIMLTKINEEMDKGVFENLCELIITGNMGNDQLTITRGQHYRIND